MQPFKCPINNGQKDNAIFSHPSYAALFGRGHDLYIANNANTNQSSFSNLGLTYKPPAGYQYNTQETKSLFTGSYQYRPTEIEVFYWIITTFDSTKNTNPRINTIQ